MTRSRDMQLVRLHSVLVCLVCAVTVACAPQPVVPSGATRVPVNTEEMINQYRERVTIEQREKQERTVLTRQVEALTKQIQELTASLTLVQLQQQETERGRSPHGSIISVAAPLVGHLPTCAAATARATETEWADPPTTQAAAPQEGVELPGKAMQTVTQRSRRQTSMDDRPMPESQEPRVIELGPREQVFLHRHSVMFRVSEQTGHSEFEPSAALESYLKKALTVGHCLQVRGYTDGDEDRWIERETARLRANNARAYLMAQGVAPGNIDVHIFPIGKHVGDNATRTGRAKNRRVEIEVMEMNPASVWPHWQG